MGFYCLKDRDPAFIGKGRGNVFASENAMIEVPISNFYNKVALIDDTDRDLAQYKFNVCSNENLKLANRGMLSRIIMRRKLGRSLTKDELVDFVDGNRFNLRRDNLRLATRSQIRWHSRKPKNNTTGFKGVIKVGKRYKAHIAINSKTIHLGMFDTAYDAYVAYCNAAKKYHGEFACLE